MEAGVRSALSHVRLVAAIAVLFLAGAFTSSASAATEPVPIDQSPTLAGGGRTSDLHRQLQ